MDAHVDDIPIETIYERFARITERSTNSDIAASTDSEKHWWYCQTGLRRHQDIEQQTVLRLTLRWVPGRMILFADAW